MGTLFKGHRTTFITQQNKVSQCAPESTLYHQSVQREGRNDQWDGFISKRDTQHQQNVTPWAASVLNQNCMSDGRLVSDAPSSPRPPPTRRFFRGISRPIRLHIHSCTYSQDIGTRTLYVYAAAAFSFSFSHFELCAVQIFKYNAPEKVIKSLWWHG